MKQYQPVQPQGRPRIGEKEVCSCGEKKREYHFKMKYKDKVYCYSRWVCRTCENKRRENNKLYEQWKKLMKEKQTINKSI